MRKICLSIIGGILCLNGLLNGQAKQKINNYSITIPTQFDLLKYNHLKLGGTNYLGSSIEVNNYYLSFDGHPVIPVVGEFHFSRYPNKYWDESIKKMKAGGIDIIATYVFWIMHEEEEGKFDWSGDKNLRKFVELCAANQMKVIVRVGPFCHGEIRNGGLPDWLLGRPLVIRSNDSLYLYYVQRLYNQIGRQLEGLFFKDGGPIIAVQLENEYQHSASPWGLTYPGQPHDWTAAEQDRASTQAGVGVADGKNTFTAYGDSHMKILKQLAINSGLIAPLYTATGWGYAAIIENESLPVSGAYPYPTWANQSMSNLYLYTDLHKNPDYSPVRYIPTDYPNITAEIGGGIMVTYSRRPTVPANSLDALINRFLGSGSNGIGYYMYHGGSTPNGKTVFYSDEAYGYPKISYDFQAPIGEYGQTRESFHRLKLIHYFISAYGHMLAPMRYVAANNAKLISAQDTRSLRYAVRTNGTSGFLFMHNFQDHATLYDIENVQLVLNINQKPLKIPYNNTFTLKKGENTIWPFYLNLHDITLKYATVQPLTFFENNHQLYYVFIANEGIPVELSFLNQNLSSVETNHLFIKALDNQQQVIYQLQGSLPAQLKLKSTSGKEIHILVIDRPMARQAYLGKFKGNSYLVISNALVLAENNSFTLLSRGSGKIQLAFYPSLLAKITPNVGECQLIPDKQDLFSQYMIQLPDATIKPDVKNVADNKIAVALPQKMPEFINDYFLNVDYEGDVAMAFIDGKLVADHFYYGQSWEIGLKRFIDNLQKPEMVLYFRPLYPDASFYQDFSPEKIPSFVNQKQYLKIHSISFEPEYKVLVTF